ncbi:hypothetical protein L596_027288 [Steinernema carpocapsae]|uniref:Uncharacterized protein n=1 Tax=Steinernema carpocapsae TaxID=34508 RepID=A0A4U5M3V5_STECR|nr:hypothetical protein L596_027288 [Steinernema carpocapsae]
MAAAPRTSATWHKNRLVPRKSGDARARGGALSDPDGPKHQIRHRIASRCRALLSRWPIPRFRIERRLHRSVELHERQA